MTMIYTFGSRQPPIIGSGTPFKTFTSVADAISFAEDRVGTPGMPTTFYLPSDTTAYDFDGLTIPTGSHWVGEGHIRNGAFQNEGYGGSARITGTPLASLGSEEMSFSNLVIDGGITIRKQNTYFEKVVFIGSAGLTFDFESGSGASPYYCAVDKCTFRGIQDTCLEFKGQSNRISVINSKFLVEQGQRGIVGTKQGSAYPLHNVVRNCSLEHGSGVTSIGSYIFGDFRGLVVDGIYLDAAQPTFTDGAEYVLSSDSRLCRITLSNTFADDYVYGGIGHTIQGANHGGLTVGSGVSDLGTLGGIPSMVVLFSSSEATLTMWPVNRGSDKHFIIANEGGGNRTLDGSGAETINGSANLVMADNTGYMFYQEYVGAAITNWIARQLW